MVDALQAGRLFLLAGLLFLALGSVAAALVTRFGVGPLSLLGPRTRHRALVGLAGLPVLLAALLMMSAALPSVASLAMPSLDHCARHDDGHAHLCFVHLPHGEGSSVLTLGFVLLLAYAVARLALAAADLVRAGRVLDALVITAEHRADLGIALIDTSLPVCLAAGLLRPRVLLSRGLLLALGDGERAVILAHERAHVRRLDALVATVVRVLACFHLPSVARWLTSEVEIAAEQACDEESAALVGDRLLVASTILAVERANLAAEVPAVGLAAAGFGQRAVERRVESLLAEPRVEASSAGLFLASAAVIALAAAGAGELHHVTETALSFVAR